MALLSHGGRSTSAVTSLTSTRETTRPSTATSSEATWEMRLSIFRRAAATESGRSGGRCRAGSADGVTVGPDWLGWGSRSEVPARLLFALNRLEERLEVALAEPAAPLALDHLEEEGGPVLHRAGEDLKQVPVLVPVNQDVELAKPLQILVDLPHPLRQARVVAVRGAQEFSALTAQPVDTLNDVLAVQRDVLD